MKIEKQYEWRQKSKKHKAAYHQAAKMLYGIQEGELFVKDKPQLVKPKADVIPTEAFEQIRFVAWLKKEGYWVCGSANGGYRNYFEAAKFKRMGVAAGFPDIFVPLPTPSYHGFLLEMKRQKGGKLSALQVEWLQYLREKGYFAEVAYGFDEAKELFLNYVNDYPRAA